MKRKMIAYWICTVVIALCIGSGGAAQVLRVPQNVEGLTALGYPLHFIVLLGVWKVLGALTLLASGLRLVKEWAYAGIFIDLSGAVVASAANTGGALQVIAPVVLIGILAASWALRPESRRLLDAKERAATPNPASRPSLRATARRGTAQGEPAGAT
jgi:DoxX-like family